MSKEPQIFPSNEILSAMLSHHVGADTQSLTTDATGYIAETYGVDLSAYDVSVVENSDAAQHLVLPFYPQLEQIAAFGLSDVDAEEVAGGFDIFIGAIALTAILCGGSVIAIGGAGLGIMFGPQPDENGNK